MNFASDNWAGATPAVMAALTRANSGFAPAYDNDPLTAKVHATFSEIFERDVAVFFMPTGTAANVLCLSTAARASGYVFCTPEAHILTDEFNGPEFFTGMKLVPVASEHGVMGLAALEAALGGLTEGHSGPPAVLSLTNATEAGTVYSPDRIGELTACAKSRGMAVHIDGARFANAVAATGASPADLTWRAGADLMSFGGAKNGCFAAEAVILFAPEKFPDTANLRQRAGHTISKSRFVAAQFEGYFEDGGWLRTAAHANAMGARLAAGIRRSNAARLDWQGAANELFPIMSGETAAKLRAAGASFHTWERLANGDERVRLVTSFATSEADVDAFLDLLG